MKNTYAVAFLTMSLIISGCAEKTKEITIRAINGQNGESGRDGLDGKDGASCSVSKLDNVSTVTCGDSQVTILDGLNGIDGVSGENGQDGRDGVDGQDGKDATNPSGVTIVQFINPCGSNWSNDELILRLSDGSLLAVYDGGPNEDRLTLLAPGSYHTTDHNNVNRTCNFTIDSNLTLTDNNGNIYRK